MQILIRKTNLEQLCIPTKLRASSLLFTFAVEIPLEAKPHLPTHSLDAVLRDPYMKLCNHSI